MGSPPVADAVAVPREYPPCPLVGVGIFVLRGEQCLIVQRGHEPSRGSWSIPGGRVELGESLESAARRELAEECGALLSVDLRGVAFVLDRVTRDADERTRFHYVLIDFVAEHVSGEPVAGDDAAAVRWATPDEIGTLPTTARLADYVREAIRRRDSGLLGASAPDRQNVP
jgi:ADP-ribose pyrophosphatase YjhB (NUDIX family)